MLDAYYKEDDQFIEITVGDDLTNPITTVHNGRTGDTVSTQLFLRNDDATKWYSNIIIKPVDLVGANPYGDVAYNETGWGIKLSPGAEEPSLGEWEDISWGNEIIMETIGTEYLTDTTTYFPFWRLETCPPNTDAQVKTDLVLNVSYTENSVI